jgi:hypothetical protein
MYNNKIPGQTSLPRSDDAGSPIPDCVHFASIASEGRHYERLPDLLIDDLRNLAQPVRANVGVVKLHCYRRMPHVIHGLLDRDPFGVKKYRTGCGEVSEASFEVDRRAPELCTTAGRNSPADQRSS